MSISSVSRPLQPIFLPREAPPPKVEVLVADEIRACYTKYASLPTEIRNILSLDQFMNHKKRREESVYTISAAKSKLLDGKAVLTHEECVTKPQDTPSKLHEN